MENIWLMPHLWLHANIKCGVGCGNNVVVEPLHHNVIELLRHVWIRYIPQITTIHL